MTHQLRLNRYGLDIEEREALTKTLEERLVGCELDPDRDTMILTAIGAHALTRYLPPQARDALGAFAGSGDHALLIDNLPIPALPRTPISGFADERRLAVVNALQLGLIRLLGMVPFAVDYENEGRLFRNVVPNPAAAGTTSSWGADTEFSWHTDNPHLAFGEPGRDPRTYTPHFLTFYTARNAEAVSTEMVPVDSVVERICDQAVRTLMSPAFRIAAPDSNAPSADGRRREVSKAPLLTLHHGAVCARFDPGTTTARHGQGQFALDTWRAAIEATPPCQPVLRPGQFLVFDNHRILHRRQAFRQGADGRQRWLRRCYAS